MDLKTTGFPQDHYFAREDEKLSFAKNGTQKGTNPLIDGAAAAGKSRRGKRPNKMPEAERNSGGWSKEELRT